MLSELEIYDEVMKVVPEYDLLSDLLVDQLERLYAPLRVLEVGSGTGLLTEKLLASSRVTDLTCVDPDSGACEVLRRRCGRVQVAVHARHFERVKGLRKFDAVVSRFAFHHVPDEAKLEFLRHTRRSLRRGGLSLIGDMTLPHYEGSGDRLAAVTRYYEITFDYVRRFGNQFAIDDQAQCLERDLNQDEEYKICRCRAEKLIEEAGLLLKEVYPISHYRRGCGPVWPGIYLFVATCP